ncbi:MAG: hypothetical protein HYY17_13740 [Planctomycetes bacterium]|nr:hypothetical protein [Planctomycetota bacterium]
MKGIPDSPRVGKLATELTDWFRGVIKDMEAIHFRKVAPLPQRIMAWRALASHARELVDLCGKDAAVREQFTPALGSLAALTCTSYFTPKSEDWLAALAEMLTEYQLLDQKAGQIVERLVRPARLLGDAYLDQLRLVGVFADPVPETDRHLTKTEKLQRTAMGVGLEYLIALAIEHARANVGKIHEAIPEEDPLGWIAERLLIATR